MNIVGMSEACEASQTKQRSKQHYTTVQDRIRQYQTVPYTIPQVSLMPTMGRTKIMQFRIGQQVRVMLPPGESTGTNTVEHFQGKASVIKAVHINRKGKSLLGYSYTLLGCKTKWGIDLEFCEEWLVPLDEGVEA